jgi:hypothetical protein
MRVRYWNSDFTWFLLLKFWGWCCLILSLLLFRRRFKIRFSSLVWIVRFVCETLEINFNMFSVDFRWLLIFILNAILYILMSTTWCSLVRLRQVERRALSHIDLKVVTRWLHSELWLLVFFFWMSLIVLVGLRIMIGRNLDLRIVNSFLNLRFWIRPSMLFCVWLSSLKMIKSIFMVLLNNLIQWCLVVLQYSRFPY